MAERAWAQPLPPAEPLSRLETAAGTAAWVREFAAPWVQRRLRGTSSGDGRAPKRPTLTPVD